MTFAVGDFVKLVLEFGDEAVVGVLGEVFSQKFVNDIARIGRHKVFLLKGNVLTVFERGNNVSVSRGAANAVFFKDFSQRDLVVAW